MKYHTPFRQPQTSIVSTEGLLRLDDYLAWRPSVYHHLNSANVRLSWWNHRTKWISKALFSNSITSCSSRNLQNLFTRPNSVGNVLFTLCFCSTNSSLFIYGTVRIFLSWFWRSFKTLVKVFSHELLLFVLAKSKIISESQIISSKTQNYCSTLLENTFFSSSKQRQLKSS